VSEEDTLGEIYQAMRRNYYFLEQKKAETACLILLLNKTSSLSKKLETLPYVGDVFRL